MISKRRADARILRPKLRYLPLSKAFILVIITKGFRRENRERSSVRTEAKRLFGH